MTPPTPNQKSCDHCGMDIAMRNPSGFCDHLYYPENCGVCHKKHGKPTYYSLEQALEAERKVAEVKQLQIDTLLKQMMDERDTACLGHIQEVANLQSKLDIAKKEIEKLIIAGVEAVIESRNNYCPCCHARLDEICGPCKWCKDKKNHLDTERSMYQAWRKRCEEAEAELSSIHEEIIRLKNCPNDHCMNLHKEIANLKDNVTELYQKNTTALEVDLQSKLKVCREALNIYPEFSEKYIDVKYSENCFREMVAKAKEALALINTKETT